MEPNAVGIAYRVKGSKGTAFAVPWGYLAPTAFPDTHPLARFSVFVDEDYSDSDRGDPQDVEGIHTLTVHPEELTLVRLGHTSLWIAVQPASSTSSFVPPSSTLPSSSTQTLGLRSSTQSPASRTSAPVLTSSSPSTSLALVLPQDVTVDILKSVFWSTTTVVDVPADGHCGYHVLFGSQDASTSQRAHVGRRMFFKYLDSPTGACKDLPGHDDTFWQGVKARVFPGGRLPSQVSFAPASLPQYLSSEDLPWMAQMMQAIVCVCDSQDPRGWASFVPIKIKTDTRLPVIGMYHTEQHWQRCSMKTQGPLPPVVTCTWFWRAQNRQRALSSDGHQRLHRRYAFAVWKAPADGQCGCEGGQESSSSASTKRKRDSAVVVE